MDIDKTAKETASECEGHIRKAIDDAYQAGLDDACAGIARAINVLYHKASADSPEEKAFFDAAHIAEGWSP